MKKHLLLLLTALLLMAVEAKSQIALSPNSLEVFSYIYGEGPSVQQINVSANHVSTINVVSDSAYFLVSIDNVNYSLQCELNYSILTNTQTIYIRMVKDLDAGEYSGRITFSDQAGVAAPVLIDCNGHVDKATVAKPAFNPMQGSHHGPLQVTISCETDGAIIRYTLDENEPNEQSPEYNDTIVLPESKIIKAKAWKDDENYEPSEVATADYIIQYRIHATTNGGGVVNDNQSVDVLVDFNNPFTLRANSYSDYIFEKWTDNDVEIIDNPYVIEHVESDHEIVAHFKHIPYIVTGTAYPIEAGRVNVDGPDVVGGDATLEAIPNAGWRFDHWEDDESNTNPFRTIFNVNTDTIFVAYFSRNEYSITVSSNNLDWGHIDVENNTYYYNDLVVLTAVPTDSTDFIQWDDNGDSTNPRQITIISDTTITATFAAKSTRINVIADPEDGGIVTGEGDYPFWMTCTVTAQANESYTFINWTEEDVIVSTESSYSFQAGWNHDRTLVAHFAQIPIVGIVETPETICDNEPLDLVIPECINTIGGEWQLSPDTTFTNIVLYNGEKLIQSYDDWYLRYIAYDGTDSVPSNIVSISVQSYIPENEVNHQLIAKGPKGGKYVLIYPNPKDNYKYQWYRDNAPIPNANMQYYYQQGGLTEGDYKVYISYTEDRTCGAFSPAKTISNNGSVSLSIYPNPAHVNDNLFVVNDSESELQFFLYSIDGRLLHSQTVTAYPTAINLHLPQGIYVAYLFDETGFVKVEKIVIQ